MTIQCWRQAAGSQVSRDDGGRSAGARPPTTIFKGKKVALFAVPGAYTGTCHKMHLPSIFLNAYAIKDKGVDAIGGGSSTAAIAGFQRADAEDRRHGESPHSSGRRQQQPDASAETEMLFAPPPRRRSGEHDRLLQNAGRSRPRRRSRACATRPSSGPGFADPRGSRAWPVPQQPLLLPLALRASQSSSGSTPMAAPAISAAALTPGAWQISRSDRHGRRDPYSTKVAGGFVGAVMGVYAAEGTQSHEPRGQHRSRVDERSGARTARLARQRGRLLFAEAMAPALIFVRAVAGDQLGLRRSR